MDEAQIRRNVPVPDMLGYGDMDIVFNRLAQDGLRVLNPEGGYSVLLDLSSFSSQTTFSELARSSLPPEFGLNLPRGRRAPRAGFFGTGRGDQLIPIILDQNSPLVQKGLAQPGRYSFRRSALEGWLRAYDRRK
jgi:hypothetical protein